MLASLLKLRVGTACLDLNDNVLGHNAKVLMQGMYYGMYFYDIYHLSLMFVNANTG